MLNKNVTLVNGFLYSTVFTLTHIADILILGIILLVVNSFTDIYAKLAFLQAFSIYALLFISIYIFFRNLSGYIQSKFKIRFNRTHKEKIPENDNHSHSHKNAHEHSHNSSHNHEHNHDNEHDDAHAHEHSHKMIMVIPIATVLKGTATELLQRLQ